MKIRAVALLALLLSACLASPAMPATSVSVSTLPVADITVVSPEGERIPVSAELATTPQQQRYGLMGRTRLDDGHGMLFSFPSERPLSFWMKDTLIPLDVLYFRADGTFVSAATMAPCQQDPCAAYPSEGPALYALEVRAGSAADWGTGNGWRLETESIQARE